MGTYINSVAEKQVNGKWQSVPVRAFEEKNYALFGWLAGVRNYAAVPPITALRGWPEDCSASKLAFGDCFSYGWVSLEELLAVDYEQIVENRRVSKEVSPGLWDGAVTCPAGKGKKMTLREFLGPTFFKVLERLKAAGAERVLFCFS